MNIYHLDVPRSQVPVPAEVTAVVKGTGPPPDGDDDGRVATDHDNQRKQPSQSENEDEVEEFLDRFLLYTDSDHDMWAQTIHALIDI